MKHVKELLLTVILAFIIVPCYAQKQSGKLIPVCDSITKLNVYDFVPEFPSFPGGEVEFLRYINKNYIKTADDMQSTFQLSFVINKDGKIKGVRIFNKKKNEYTNEEKKMIKVFESMPLWKPGIYNEKKVNVLLTRRVSIRFQ
ncbi:hypothetical protein [Bacteroides ovatus]|nr:hypothetical protein [Bacteroides ovatus]MCM1722624.1 hypothetical protein [Bacteroides ovatus]MCM1757670.1 hypothetical protein [Bacteroides ovatus]MCM1869122.1 hypothetical protein [Bacteroides ovatus]MCM1912989.1 hypothetical protein [Bacteroides ovatus]